MTNATRRAARQWLESLQRAGVGEVPRVEMPAWAAAASAAVEMAAPAYAPELKPTEELELSPRKTSERSEPRAKTSPSAKPQAAGLFTDSRPRTPEPISSSFGERNAQLAVIAQEVAGCTRCTELAATRTQTVFGVGNPAARLCFLGEAPGADEDRQGEPFVGRAGQLLNKIIVACGFAREDVYILNILKCRPPENRNPTPEESANCKGYLLRQLEIIQPEFLVCLGSVAATNLLNTTASIGRLRGQIHDWNGTKVLCTYHPAYLLRNPSAKRDVWDDMKFLLGEMGLPVPESGG